MSDQTPPPDGAYGQPAPGYGQPAAGYGQPAPGYGQPPTPGGYGYPTAPPAAPGYFPVQQTSGKATAILVLGIVSLVLMCGYGLGIIPAIVALAMAPSAKREIATSGGRLNGDGQIKAGVICSWITVGVVVVLLVLFLGLVASFHG